MKTTTVTIGSTKYKLVMRPESRSKVPVWDVLSSDGRFRLGVVYKRYAGFLIRKFGWQTRKEFFWVFESFYNQDVWVSRTRTEAILNLYRLQTPDEAHREPPMRRTIGR